ncbi:hypothetical protein N7G274_001810 [Stereocaulon virgatum]|uniref:C2H2-type domain-containing protein n=1 Tax=Stereocaulon virgatum TaxID=373712 RepID=A0ABR4AKR9_9LECA
MAYMPGPSAGNIAAATAPTLTDDFNDAVAASYGYHSTDLLAAVTRITDHAPSATVNAVPTNGTAEHRPNCIECHRDFGRQSDLDRHMKIHSPDVEVFQCQVAECLYSSIREDKWLEHMRRRHQQGGVAPMVY